MAWTVTGAVVSVDKETLINTINEKSGTAVHGGNGSVEDVQVVRDADGNIAAVTFYLVG